MDEEQIVVLTDRLHGRYGKERDYAVTTTVIGLRLTMFGFPRTVQNRGSLCLFPPKLTLIAPGGSSSRALAVGCCEVGEFSERFGSYRTWPTKPNATGVGNSSRHLWCSQAKIGVCANVYSVLERIIKHASHCFAFSLRCSHVQVYRGRKCNA